MAVTTKSADEIERMREAGRLAAQVLDRIAPEVVPGVTTGELDAICHDYIVNQLGCIPAPLNYAGFPKSVCTSVNHVVCHGIPGNKKLRKGDILNIDVTVIREGYHGDTSRMFQVGQPTIQGHRICDLSWRALWAGIEQVRPGATLGDIGHAIQTLAEGEGGSVVRDYCGHGIGTGFHEEPQVLHYGSPGEGLELTEGMTFTIEPMINAGRKETKVLKDNWTVVTRDHSLSAQWEHTLLVTPTGYEVLTHSDAYTD